MKMFILDEASESSCSQIDESKYDNDDENDSIQSYDSKDSFIDNRNMEENGKIILFKLEKIKKKNSSYFFLTKVC